jgi:hypothetical protein
VRAGRMRYKRQRYPYEASVDGLNDQLRAAGMFALREYRFHPTRQWKFDLAFPEKKVGIEYQGGIFLPGGGGHQRTRGIVRDMEKFNEAQMLGWKVLLFGPDEVREGKAALTVSWFVLPPVEHGRVEQRCGSARV